METNIAKLRSEEVRSLTRYYSYLGGFVGLFLSFPRLLILSGLWGYSSIYGHHDVSSIFTCMQILSILKSSCDLFTRSLGRAIVIQPSVQRIEHFLKMAEAPVLPPHRTPDWVEMWPDMHAAVDPEAPLLRRPEQPPASLRIRGTFKWLQDGVPVLHDLDLEVPRGELVAVVGSVGAGKSTLIQAVLGELYPDLTKDASVSRPAVIAYCSQVPHIAEGTLKDNVLFGLPYDEDRYKAAIKAASLENDLLTLPGGDEVPIGSRGITLSGGQKARVSMARAAYHQGSELVILDDPFGSVDAPTAMILLDKLLLGPLMKGRTRLVILQPDNERIAKFDRVVIVSNGRIVEQGTPDKVMQTDAYQKLQSSRSEDFHQGEQDLSGTSSSTGGTYTRPSKDENQASPNALREEEFEGRPTLEILKQYCRLGKWRNILNTSILFCVQIFLYLLCDLVLANWTNAIAHDPQTDDKPYLLGYLFWLGLGTAFWVICWKFGEWFTLRISAQIHGMVLHKNLRAPIDRFFDKHPVGRIMNRMSADLAVVDLFLFMKSTGTIAILYQTLIPLLYIHTILPFALTVLAIPFYYLIWTFCVRYWNTTVPLRYCMSNARSEVNSLVSDVINNNVVIRAYGDQERITLEMCDAIDNQLKAALLGERVLRRWLVNRLVYMWSFYTTATYIVGLLNTQNIGAGTLGLCLTNLLLLESLIEPNLDAATGAQFEFIALARIYEYLGITQEKPMHLKGDAKYRSFTARVPRKGLGQINFFETNSSTVEVRRNGKVILQSTPDGRALMPALDCLSGKGSEASLLDLAPASQDLAAAHSWHRIISVNDVYQDAKAMAKELCTFKVTALSFSGKDQVVLGVQSGWLSDGARVQVEGLKAGYADSPRDVLKGITLTLEPRSKNAIVGTTGCGKSSLLLVLLRVLEPRAGRVLINGVDTRDLGLSTLRSSLGLVPQDPVLFSGSLRHNLDPLRAYTDGRLWQALRTVHLEDLVKSWPMQLEHPIADEGSNVSFGQRQLICLARMVLRQPALLLLDEATSAIDPNTQEMVQETINSAFPGSTIVAVAHRLETVLNFDRVFVLDKGTVAEEGPVKELASRKDGIFSKMLSAKKTW
jgi:ABC-type multidrug transport system fused ATPase/permease subunit